MLHYLKHLATPLIMGLTMLGLVLQGPYAWLGFAALVICSIGGDGLLPDDLSKPEYRHKWILNALLYLTLPTLLCVLTLFAWTTGVGADDFLGIGALVGRWFEYDMFAARAGTEWPHRLGAILSVGLSVAGYGTNVAHELTHRTWDPWAMRAGRWLLGQSLNADFAVEHVYGHHETVATEKDPATARRGESVYAFALRSIVYGHISAWRLELNRLARRKRSPFSPQNRMLSGYGISLAYIVAFAAAGGWVGVLYFLAQGLFARFILEVVNYMEHYGLIRVAGRPVAPRHSWNTNRAMSSLLLFSLTRHSAHHEKGDLPFWKLEPYPGAPEMPFGYLTTIFVCLVPPLWERIMAPRLLHWDRTQASAEELEIARIHNQQSGVAKLVMSVEAAAR